MKRKPTSPGEILLEEFLKPLGMSQSELSDYLDFEERMVNQIISKRSNITSEIALKLAATFNTTADFWLNAQKALDLWKSD